MKYVGLTQKIEISRFGNPCDVIDQEWYKFFNCIDAMPVLIPNNLEIVKRIVNDIDLTGFVLSGGNDLAQFGGNVIQRDEVERYIIQFSMDNNIPIIGVCRGMQLILDFFSVPIHKIDGHVQQNHNVKFLDNQVTVNSFHNYGCKLVSEEFQVLAVAEDRVVEAIKHRTYNIYGLMWHPERNKIISDIDRTFFKEVFQL